MREFHYSAINHQKWDSEILGLVAAIYKEAGKQELYLNYSRLFSIESASYDKQGGSIKVNARRVYHSQKGTIHPWTTREL